jgi:hypothetical protein
LPNQSKSHVNRANLGREKDTVCTNGTNRNDAKQIIINQISEEDEDNINTIWENEYKGQNYNPNYQNKRSGPIKFVHCKQPGHTVEKCFQNVRL